MIPSISFRHLQYFTAVFEEGSFTKAAERERCTQPALSAQVRNVEELVGCNLFERSVAGAVPTAAGKRFYRHAISILRSLRMAELEMATVTEEISGTVRAGVIPSLVRGILPSFLGEFIEKHPAIDLRITESFSGTLTDWLLAQEIDLAFVVEPPRHEGLEMEKLADGPAVLISGKAFGLSPGPLQLRDIPPVKMIMPGHRHSLRATIERAIWTRSLRVTRSLGNGLGAGDDYVRPQFGLGNNPAPGRYCTRPRRSRPHTKPDYGRAIRNQYLLGLLGAVSTFPGST